MKRLPRPRAMGVVLVLLAFAACSSADGEAPFALDDAGDGDGGAGTDAAPIDLDDAGASDARDAAAEADAGGVAKCTVDWCETPLPIPDGGTLSLMDVWAPAPNDAWAVSEEGLVLRWNGAQWTVVWDAQTPLYGIRGDHEGDIWVVGAAGAIFRGRAGATWTSIPSGTTTDLMEICEASRDAERPRNVAIVGEAGIVLRWTGAVGEDGNPSWETSNPAVDHELFSVSCAGSDVWVAGRATDWFEGGPRIYRESAEGWLAQPTIANASRNDSYSKIWAFDRQNLWVRGRGNILRATPAGDGGALGWVEEYAPVAGAMKRPSSIWGTGPNDVWIASSRGRVHHWDGSSLKITATAKGWDVLPNNLRAVSGSGPDDVWVVGDGIALHRNVNGQD
ncbi:MAG: hypothetical protein KF850_31560 [Labilithrix sp.]|nr:hypothetical protein [Labilithrix sp.]